MAQRKVSKKVQKQRAAILKSVKNPPIRKELRGAKPKAPTEKEINDKINAVMHKFMRNAANKNSIIKVNFMLWANLIPVVGKCLNRLEKVTFPDIQESAYSIKRLSIKNRLIEAVSKSVIQNEPKHLRNHLYIFIQQLINKKK